MSPDTTLTWLCISVSVLSPQQCSKSCGSGHRQRALHCVDHSQQEVHEMYCVNQIRPPNMESCNTHACELIWITGEWTEVSGQPVCCLDDVVKLRVLRFLLWKGSQQIIVSHLVKHHIDWNHPCFQWWMLLYLHDRFLFLCSPQCSASCGQGYRQRLISCSEVHVENDNYEYGHQSLSNCPGTPPESYMLCNLDPCPSPQEWRVGIWGPVSESVLLNVL